MTISKYKTKKGWRYRFTKHLGVNPITGEDIQKSRGGFKSKKEAESAERKTQYEFDNNLLKLDGGFTYQEAYDKWLPLYKNTVKESTFQKTITQFKLHLLPQLGCFKLSEIKPYHCQKLAENLCEVYSEYKKVYRYAVRVFEYAVKVELFSGSNPFKKVILPAERKSDSETIFLEKEELKKYLNLMSDNIKWHTFFHILGFTGMRKGELIALEKNDIDFKKMIIHVRRTATIGLSNKQYIDSTKTFKGKRDILIDPVTARKIKAWLSRPVQPISNLVFPDGHGKYMCLSKPNQYLDRFIKRNNLKDISPHSFRHTHCSLLFEAGWSIKEVQDRLGHEDIKTTMDVYAHVTKNRKKESIREFTNFMEA